MRLRLSRVPLRGTLRLVGPSGHLQSTGRLDAQLTPQAVLGFFVVRSRPWDAVSRRSWARPRPQRGMLPASRASYLHDSRGLVSRLGSGMGEARGCRDDVDCDLRGRAASPFGGRQSCDRCGAMQSRVREAVTGGAGRPNKGMKLTKLSAAPFRGTKCRLMPAPSGMDAGTASQLIPGVRRTHGTSARRRNVTGSDDGSLLGDAA